MRSSKTAAMERSPAPARTKLSRSILGRVSAPFRSGHDCGAVQHWSAGAPRIQQPFDNHAVAPAAIQLSVASMDSDLIETQSFQEAAARNILRKHPAGKLVQTSGRGRLHQGD